VKNLVQKRNCRSLPAGIPTRAWIYWYNGSVEGMPEIAIGDVLKYLQQKNKP
jgi:hypothetical protein